MHNCTGTLLCHARTTESADCAAERMANVRLRAWNCIWKSALKLQFYCHLSGINDRFLYTRALFSSFRCQKLGKHERSGSLSNMTRISVIFGVSGTFLAHFVHISGNCTLAILNDVADCLARCSSFSTSGP